MMKYEFRHFSHPTHKLDYINLDGLFICNGCHQLGIGPRYNCSTCDFDLHTHCATATNTATDLRHPFNSKSHFKFLPSHPKGYSSHCIACGRQTPGFVYHCRKYDYFLHPCCAALPQVINADGLLLHLHYRPSAPCYKCKLKGENWTYRSSCKKYNLHVACANEICMENWHALGGGGSGSNDSKIVLRNTIPIIRATATEDSLVRRRNNRKLKWYKLVGTGVKICFSILLGDPTSVISDVVTSLASN